MDKERKAFFDMVRNGLTVFLIMWIGFTFILGIGTATNDDMKPRISAGDIFVYYRIAKDPSIHDVVILRKNKTVYLGRVVARGGDTVEVTKDETLMVNGEMVVEDMIYYSTPYYEGFTEYPLKLASDEYFVLADRREGGEDSRYYGPVKQSEIMGTIIGQFRRNDI